MIEFRWIVILTLWTLLIGPVLDFSQRGAPIDQPTLKANSPTKKNAR